MDNLRITETNSANDSKGRAFGLEGNDFVYIIAGFVVALGLYILLSVLFHCGKVISVGLVIPFFAGPLLWIVFLRHNRPAGYAEDWFEHTINGSGWSLPTSQPKSSFHEKRT